MGYPLGNYSSGSIVTVHCLLNGVSWCSGSLCFHIKTEFRFQGFSSSLPSLIPNPLTPTLLIMSSADSTNSYYSAMVAPPTPPSDSILVQAAFAQSADLEARIALLEFQVSELTNASRQLSGWAV